MFAALRLYTIVMPAQAGIQVVLPFDFAQGREELERLEDWIPAFAGMSAPVKAPHQHGASPCRSMPQLRSRR